MDTLCRKMTPIALLIASIAPAAHAQSTDNSVMLEEILVTAQRRAEASVDVPISLTTLSQSQLDSANIEELKLRLLPGEDAPGEERTAQERMIELAYPVNIDRFELGSADIRWQGGHWQQGVMYSLT